MKTQIEKQDGDSTKQESMIKLEQSRQIQIEEQIFRGLGCGVGMSKEKEISRFMKQENDLLKTFQTTTEEMISFNSFEEVEEFMRSVLRYPKTVAL